MLEAASFPRVSSVACCSSGRSVTALQELHLMYPIEILEQGARSVIHLTSDFEFFQWEKSGIAEG